MPSKTEEYLALAQRTANGLTRYWESWTDYLTTASRLYKYPFADQLMIYAQRPDATACAEFDIWRNRMNRYVRRGSKGIALLDESSGFPRLHYVFDVSDTGVRRNSRDPEVWQLGPDLVQPVSEMLAATYGISGERVSQQLADVAGKLVADYWDNNSGDILAIVDGSLLMDYDEAGVEMQFKSAAAISVTYTLLERCGLEPAGWFDKDDFQAIYNFSTPDSVYALGAAVSDMSREVLRNIERTVKTTIRRRNVERSQHESTIISLRKPSTKCVRAAWWRLSPVVTRWTVKILLPASTWQNEPICWGPFVCLTTLSVPTLVRMLSAILSFCRSVTALRILNLHGCSLARPRMALLSTATLLSTRRWCWAN